MRTPAQHLQAAHKAIRKRINKAKKELHKAVTVARKAGIDMALWFGAQTRGPSGEIRIPPLYHPRNLGDLVAAEKVPYNDGTAAVEQLVEDVAHRARVLERRDAAAAAAAAAADPAPAAAEGGGMPAGSAQPLSALQQAGTADLVPSADQGRGMQMGDAQPLPAPQQACAAAGPAPAAAQGGVMLAGEVQPLAAPRLELEGAGAGLALAEAQGGDVLAADVLLLGTSAGPAVATPQGGPELRPSTTGERFGSASAWRIHA